MKIVAISDTHGKIINIPKADVLFICGDIAPDLRQDTWYNSVFIEWMNSLEVKKIFIIPGNHDFYLENIDPEYFKESIPKLTICEHAKLYEYSDGIKNIKITGTPYCKTFCNWAFMPGTDKLPELYSQIPKNVDFFLSHDAPDINNLGSVLEPGFYYSFQRVGNPHLVDCIKNIKPKYALCGHIHSGNHSWSKIGSTKCANVSICNEKYQPVNNPLIIEI